MKAIHEATRSGFVRAIWYGFVDRSWGNLQEHTKRNQATTVIEILFRVLVSLW